MVGYVYLNDVELYGVTKNYIWKALHNYTSGKSMSWANIKDPKDKRKVLIQYDSIPLTTIEKYKMPQTYEEFCAVRQLQEIREKNQREQELQQRLTVIKSGKEEMENSWLYNPVLEVLEHGYKEYLHKYKTRLYATNCKEERVQEQAFKYAKVHVLYMLFVEKSGGKDNTGHGTYKEMFEFMNEFKKYHIIPENISSYMQFSNKMREIKAHLKTGADLADLLVRETKFLRSGKKTDDFHIGLLMYYATHPKHYAMRVLADLINHHADIEGKNLISESWVKAQMNNPYNNSLRVLIDSARRGEKWKNDNVLPYLSRQDSMHPNNTWFIDGTPTQLFCKSKDGKQIRLYLFVVLDACTRKIIGFNINSTGEDRFMVMDALKMAIRYTGYIPYEIVSDNFSANKTEEIKQMQGELLKMGTKWRFCKTGNPQDKSQVERFNRTFQSVQQSLLEEFIGEGITSTMANGRIDPEFIRAVSKTKGLIPDEHMKHFIASLLCIYNSKSLSGRLSPNEKYRTFPTDKGIKTDETNIPKIFWKKTEATVRRGQITIQEDNKKYEYYLDDNHLMLSLHSMKVIVRYHKDYKDSVFIYDNKTDELIKEIKLKVKGYVSNAEVPEGEEKVNYIFGAKKKSFNDHLKSETDRYINKGLEIVGQTSETFIGVSALSLGKECLNDIENQILLGIFSEEEKTDLIPLDRYEEVATSGKAVNTKSKKILSASKLLQQK